MIQFIWLSLALLTIWYSVILIQALIFITVIEVEPITLILMLLSAAAGAILGAGIVSKMSEKKIRLTMGFAFPIMMG